jgi:Family of unknown function (DUF6298)/Putative collagen-binding domain of a collagenase
MIWKAAALALVSALVVGSDQRGTSDIVIPTTRLVDALQSVSYSAVLRAHVRTLPYDWRTFDGNLAPGVALNAATRPTLGTPTEPGKERQPVQTGLGPLRVAALNPRYFQDASGKVVYLTGSHNWTDFQDMIPAPEGKSIGDLGGYAGYLDFLKWHHHNFTRLWVVEHAWDADNSSFCSPIAYARTGPGTALDGKTKFQLDRFNQAYFDRLRQRVADAQARGIYVAVMLFDAWSTGARGVWNGHPFNRNNNVNGIDGDPNGDEGIGFHSMRMPAIVALQRAYTSKVIDTVNDFDNVIYEIANEVNASAAWQAYFIDFVHQYEATKPKHHPVGTTAGDQATTEVTNQWLMNSAADWVAPRNEDQDYLGVATGPPAADSSKVIIIDSDHLPRGSADMEAWVWKSFMRGLNPVFMDSLDLASKQQETVRRAMGQTLTYTNRIDLAHMSPRGDLVSSGYCLANPGREYLVYSPRGPRLTVNLSGSSGTFTVEWFQPATGKMASGRRRLLGASASLRAPFSGPVVLYLVAIGPHH